MPIDAKQGGDMSTISTISNAKEVVANRAAVKTILVTSFVVMTALGAYVRIPLPFTPVPITLQTFFVLLCGAVLGRKLGVLAQTGYVGLGVLGISLFQGFGAGILHLAGPTGGYLVGFIAASFIIGKLFEKNRDRYGFFHDLSIMFAGLLAIYVCGITWLMAGYKLSFTKALLAGVIPFIPGAFCKLIAVSWVYTKIRTRCEKLLR